MIRKTYVIELLTPCFCAGANQIQPEIRVPSIRGHLRDWHERLGFGPVADIWGGVGGTPKSSKIAIRLLSIPMATAPERILPHKQGGGARNATSARQEFRLEMCAREQHAEAFRRAEAAMDAWCLLGSLGLRGNRAAGSVWRPEFNFADVSAFACRMRECKLDRLDIRITEAPMDARMLRETASDTVSDRGLFGGINPRAPSPVRMKAVRIGGSLRLAVWSDTPIVEQALDALKRKPDARRWQPLRFLPVE